jgi:hypothetical protein
MHRRIKILVGLAVLAMASTVSMYWFSTENVNGAGTTQQQDLEPNGEQANEAAGQQTNVVVENGVSKSSATDEPGVAGSQPVEIPVNGSSARTTSSKADIGFSGAEDATELMNRAQRASAMEQKPLKRMLFGTVVEICEWSREGFEQGLHDQRWPDVERTQSAADYLEGYQERFCEGADVSEIDRYIEEVAVEASDDATTLSLGQLSNEWRAIRESGSGQELAFIQRTLGGARTPAEFIDTFSSLNAIVGDYFWELGAGHIGWSMVRQGSLNELRVLSAEMLWCDYYGGCGVGEPQTMYDCMVYMVCQPGISRASVWRYRFSVAEIEAARRLADDLSTIIPGDTMVN